MQRRLGRIFILPFFSYSTLYVTGQFNTSGGVSHSPDLVFYLVKQPLFISTLYFKRNTCIF